MQSGLSSSLLLYSLFFWGSEGDMLPTDSPHIKETVKEIIQGQSRITTAEELSRKKVLQFFMFLIIDYNDPAYTWEMTTAWINANVEGSILRTPLRPTLYYPSSSSEKS